MVIAIFVIICAAFYAALRITHIHFVMNLTRSIKPGIYLVHEDNRAALRLGDYVEIRVPQAYIPYIYGRGYLKTGMTLIKQVGALPADTLCIFPEHFTINGTTIGKIFEKDSRGLALPVHPGCSVVDNGYFVPIGTNEEKSFDGRYMGEISQNEIIGKAEPVWIF